MKITVKISGKTLDEVREDLVRPHPFAWERVGFLTACAAKVPRGLLLLVDKYLTVEDEDYERNETVGAQIGSDAMRKAVQAAYRPKRALLHIHSHGGLGKPHFSGVDLRSADEFIPGLFSPIPAMPHGLLVLSDDDANGKLWLGTERGAVKINEFIRVDSHYSKKWRRANDLA